MSCIRCGSHAINHHCHGRDGSDADLCDVCYWRKRAEADIERNKKIANQEINCMLCLSTAHVSKDTADWLNEQGELNATSHDTGVTAKVHVGSHGYGWILYCELDDACKYPDDLARITRYAIEKHGCTYVNLDADGNGYDDLPTFDW